MHEMLATSMTLTTSLFAWGRIAIGILLSFWVLSGVLFCLRFLAFVLIDRRHSSSRLVADSSLIPFPAERFDRQSHRESSPE